jgi:mannose-1-phosphate guanylyltransferase/mannose-6-phosphate isomerase
MNLQPVILCGGSGTRLWPLSRQQYPKQLLRLAGENSLLQDTVTRLQGITLPESGTVASPILVGNEEYRFLVAEQLREIDIAHARLLLEPCGRNTAPALTLAAMAALESVPDAILIVTPADHVIRDAAGFRQAILTAGQLASSGQFVTFGIQPTRPETGYGYIESGAPASVAGTFLVTRFVEKPDFKTAEAYLAQGNFYWNSGIFVMPAQAWLDRLGQFRPDILDTCRAAYQNKQVDADFVRPGKAEFSNCPSDSIDYAVMEHLAGAQGKLCVIPMEIGWSDVGAWDALWELGPHDDQGNVFSGDVHAVDTRDTLAISGSRLVACVGLKDAIVVETPDAVLVADKHSIQQVKALVNQLDSLQRPESSSHRKVYRPWGWYDSLDRGERFQVKRIVLHPGASISLQMHHHRAEHWVVVSGTARITRGEETFLVSENESTYIPLGTVHRLENPGKVPLEIIEVQSGSYLGEDDIVRLEDRYGR